MRYRKIQSKPGRAGLTLVEMLIALALSIFIMSILSEAFVKGLEAFGNYKALADLEQRLRTVANIMRRDLRAPHFDGSKKLSECTASGKPMPMLDGLEANQYTAIKAQALLRQLAQYKFQKPSEGFFSVEEWPNRPGTPPRITSLFEGQDSTGRPSYRDQYDVLHFTSRLEGNEPDKFFYGKVLLGSPLDGTGSGNFLGRYDNANNNGLYTSQAAELLYFLDNDDTQNLPGVGTANGPILTFNLYRQAWLLSGSGFTPGDATNYNPATVGTFEQNNDVSAFHEAVNLNWFNTMADVQHSQRRIQRNAAPNPPYLPRTVPTTTIKDGSDILLTNVISYDVKVFDPFAYKLPFDPANPASYNPASPLFAPLAGRGAYVDIGDVSSMGNTYRPTAATIPGDELKPVFGATIDTSPVLPAGVPDIGLFDTGTSRFEGTPGAPNQFSPVQTPGTHPFPFTSIQITIRVYEPKSRQTRQITIIQDM